MTNGGYYWVPGTWVQPPRVGFLWTPGYWGFSAAGIYVFHAGYWGPHVGFYGGVNYGFGYHGDGFVGGRWDGNRFAYNTAVVNVNTTVIHNTYVNNVVVNNVTVNKVSYNGGAGGVAAAPTPENAGLLKNRMFRRRRCSISTCKKPSEIPRWRPRRTAAIRRLPRRLVPPPSMRPASSARGGLRRRSAMGAPNPGANPRPARGNADRRRYAAAGHGEHLRAASGRRRTRSPAPPGDRAHAPRPRPSAGDDCTASRHTQPERRRPQSKHATSSPKPALAKPRGSSTTAPRRDRAN